MKHAVQFKNGPHWVTVVDDYRRPWGGTRNEAIELVTVMRTGRFQKFRITNYSCSCQAWSDRGYVGRTAEEEGRFRESDAQGFVSHRMFPMTGLCPNCGLRRRQ